MKAKLFVLALVCVSLAGCTTLYYRYTQGRGLDAAAAGGSLIPSPTLHSRGSIGNTGGSETRPRNIAFNYIVRAA